ncbi:MAG: hypothetical protein IAE66_01680 [Xanthomonadaceae bacterium]|nr:hypothetical protein [Xanthomonadaceae bacterium]
MRAMRILLLSMLMLGLSACASSGGQMNALQQAQYAYSAAIRWGDIDGAWTQIDPAWKTANPLTDIQRERYKQIQVTGYKPVASEPQGEGMALRVVEIGVVNRNTMAERSVRYEERWRYDAPSKTWLVSSGLPDFWSGR